jgi:glycosyltransferase involved in cell wall biosynthesis
VNELHPVLRIVQVTLQSHQGGTGRIVSGLHTRYRSSGHHASMLVGRGTITSEGQEILSHTRYRSTWARAILSLARRASARSEASSQFAKWVSLIAEPNRRRRIRSGFEDFQFPATLPVISEMVRDSPTILHLHNLHGGFFDLRALPELSHLTPLVLTLHDQWVFTGHCAHSFDCERWRNGCGECPDLTIYPAIPRDRTAENFALKEEVFSRTRLHLATPCTWLMDRANESLLAPAMEEARVIPNGVDTTVFSPGSKAKERARLKLPRECQIVLCAGHVARSHWTNKGLLRSTIRYLAQEGRYDCALLFLGSDRNSQEEMDGIKVIHRQYERDVSRLAGYYRASDVYFHPARTDTFPTAILESLACGTPPVATDVGGIPEQVASLWASRNASISPPSSATGILVDGEDATDAGKAIVFLLQNDTVRARLADNGANRAASQFSITLQAERYLDWYEEILSRHHPALPAEISKPRVTDQLKEGRRKRP